MDIADMDLKPVLTRLRSRFRNAPPEGAVVGRTALRDAVAEGLGCSLLEAEQIVDTMVARGKIRLVRSPDRLAIWEVRDCDEAP
jgi:hypothetical protein